MKFEKMPKTFTKSLNNTLSKRIFRGNGILTKKYAHRNHTLIF